MINKIIAFSIKNKLIVGLAVLVLIAYGSFQLSRLPIDAVPDITNNQVQIITTAPSLGAADIERLITFPIEQANSNIPGMLEIRSFSRFGLSLVTIVFDDNTDIYWARQQVTERLQVAKEQIPAGTGIPTLAPVTTGLGEIYQYVVKPKKGYEQQYDVTSLRTIQDWMVRRQLLGVEGVADVSSFGGKLKQYEITVDPNKLNAYGLTVNDIFDALEKNNQNTGGAYIEHLSTVLFIRSEGLIGSLEDIQQIAVKTLPDGTPLMLHQVANISTGNATRYGAMTYNGQYEVAGAVVMMLKGANSNEVIKNVKARIEEIQKTLPEGVEIEAFLDRTKMVNHAIGTVEKNLLEGALIVVFVLVLFLGNVRAGLLVASVIPLSMLFAVILMNQFGVSGNLMSLGALDFGLIVDGAVIIVEAVMHQLSHSKKFSHIARLSQREMDDEVQQASGKMMNSAVFGQLIILIVYLPIFTLQGIEGKMFKPMAQTVAFALLGAFVLSLTYIPMMSALFLDKKIKHSKNFSDRWMEKIEIRYQQLLQKALSIPKSIITVTILLFTLALFILSRMGGEFIPALEEGDFAVDTRVLTGSNLNVSIDATMKSEKILLEKFPEVEKIVAKIGSGEVPTDPMPIEAADMMVILKDKEEWTSARTFDELAVKMGKALEVIPGVTYGFQYPVQMRFNELMTGARQDVVCKIFGENLDTLAHYAQQLGKLVNTVDGATHLYVEAISGMPQIVITYNRAAIAQYGLDVSSINRIVNTAFAGQSTGILYEGERRFDLVVRLAGEQRQQLQDVQQLLIPTPRGAQLPLYQLAKVEIQEGPNQIQREDAKRRIVVGFNVRGRDVQSIVQELQEKTSKNMRLPAGYYITYGGAFENLNAAKDRLSIAVPVSLALIYLLLYFAFNSLKHGLLIYSAIPLSAIGGIFALALRGMPFSISAGIGFIALFGVAVLNGIVLITEFNRLKTEGLNDLHRIVIMGTKVRLRPVLMTAFVASLGFLPMAISNGAGAEVQRPLATVVIGGLMIATLLTLFVLPILYILFEKGNPKKQPAVTTATILFVLLSLSYGTASAQNNITLKAAMDSAVANNLAIRSGQLKAAYQKELIQTANNLPPVSISSELGQVNSIYFDAKFSISQSFSFPTVYTRQKSVLKETWKQSELMTNSDIAQLRKNVAEVFYTYLYLLKKEELLRRHDSLYKIFLEKSVLRFNNGESNLMEKLTAEQQYGQIQLQLKQIRNDLTTVRIQFSYLLNTDETLLPVSEGNYLTYTPPASVSFEQHPEILPLTQEMEISKASIKLEKSKRLPDFTVGYNNMSIRGNGADNVFYNAGKRFQSAQVGIGIPLNAGAQKAAIRAADAQVRLAENQVQQNKQTLQSLFEKEYANYIMQLETVLYYENTALKNSDSITKGADLQFSSGEINYLEWMMLTNQIIALQSNYLQAVHQLNESVIQLHYLTNSNY